LDFTHNHLDKNIKNTYDELGNLIEENWYTYYGKLTQKVTLKYDENGNVIERKVYDSDGKLFEDFSFKYTYDEHGNWTKRIDYLNEFPEYILEREYEYYR